MLYFKLKKELVKISAPTILVSYKNQIERMWPLFMRDDSRVVVRDRDNNLDWFPLNLGEILQGESCNRCSSQIATEGSLCEFCRDKLEQKIIDEKENKVKA